MEKMSKKIKFLEHNYILSCYQAGFRTKESPLNKVIFAIKKDPLCLFSWILKMPTIELWWLKLVKLVKADTEIKWFKSLFTKKIEFNVKAVTNCKSNHTER